jgi:membrane-bound lytic murein transglycosylase B
MVKMKHWRIAAVVSMLLTACTSAPTVADLPERDEVRAFIEKMSQRHGFDQGQLQAWFKEAQVRSDIIDAMSRPAESKPWYQYRPIFLQPARIEGGAAFWNEHAKELQRAEEIYGVPPQIITAILGVETRYGQHQGAYRVMDSLVTLAFNYPPRAAFFKDELEQYLLLTREEGVDPLAMSGSYAGAMGQTQFISSSYRHYAIDFDGDGKRDLWNNTADAIGSVANYFKEHGWERGGAVAVPVAASGERSQALVAKGLKPSLRIADLKKQGVKLEAALSDNTLAALIELEQKDGQEYWAGLQNFYAITRYNHSPLYAMAVYQLSEEIRALHNKQPARSVQSRQ